MQKVENENDYRAFDGFALEEQKTVWRYTYEASVPINTFVRKKGKAYCQCGSKLVLLIYQYVSGGKQSQKMHGRKCPVCGRHYFTEKTLSLYPEAYIIEDDPELLCIETSDRVALNEDARAHLKEVCNKEEKFHLLFVDMEWNQKIGTSGVGDREPIQIALLKADNNFEKTQLFSKNMRLDDVNTLTEQTCKLTHTNDRAVMLANTLENVFKRVKKTFPQYQYVVAWTMATYELFMQSMKRAGVKVPEHRVLVLQDIISTIALPKGKKIRFETALDGASIAYDKTYLHYSKHDVQYMFELYKKIYMDYQDLTRNESSIANERSRIIHAPDCRYVKKSIENVTMGQKMLIFKGYRLCKCCGSEENWRRIYWEPALRRRRNCKELEFRGLPLTEENIHCICTKYDMKYSISEQIVFLTTNCGYWRIYLNGEEVDKVFHGNYQIRKSDSKKTEKCNEGFHQQKISITNFYDVVRYIYYHDKDLYANYKRTNSEAFLGTTDD